MIDNLNKNGRQPQKKGETTSKKEREKMENNLNKTMEDRQKKWKTTSKKWKKTSTSICCDIIVN
jgi:hypothetical protein